MKSVPSYSRVENEFDLDHEINQAVEETRKFVKEIKDISRNDSDAIAILKACATTIIDEM